MAETETPAKPVAPLVTVPCISDVVSCALTLIIDIKITNIREKACFKTFFIL
jgi:hypothetical protein